MQINGKRIIITGAASGIGRELTRQLAQYNCEIIMADRNADELGEAVREPENVRASLNPFVCDVSSQAGVDELFAHALATLNGVDIFIANAGFAYYERFNQADWNHIDTIYRTNTFSPIYSTIRMAELNPDNAYLTVITASTMAHWGVAGYALYSSTKAALDRFADAYRQEMPDNGRLMLVYPIGTRTKFFDSAAAPFTSILQNVDEVVSAMIRGIEQDYDAVYPSLLWRVVMTVNRVLPIFKPMVQREFRQQFENWEQQS